MDKIRIVLASNFGLLRAGLNSLLGRTAGMEVVGEIGVDRETVRRSQELKPDVLVLDVSSADRETFGVLKVLRQETPQLKIIALGQQEQDRFILRLLRAGVHGYLSHHEADAELLRAIGSVAQGEVFLCPSASGALLSGFRLQGRPRKRAA